MKKYITESYVTPTKPPPYTLPALIRQAQRRARHYEKWYAYCGDIHAKIAADKNQRIHDALLRVLLRGDCEVTR